MKTILILIVSILSINILNCSFQSTLFNRMSKDRKGENLIISPLSIFQALSLATNGAKGQTQQEMLDLFQISTIEELNDINYEIISLFQKFSTIVIANAVMTKFTPLKNLPQYHKNISLQLNPW